MSIAREARPGPQAAVPQPAVGAAAPPTPAGTAAHAGVVLRVSEISKTFGGTQALCGVTLGVRRGEIHALVGGNGSGKSTLVKIIAGIYRGDPGGQVTVGGHTVPAERTSPDWARQVGLHVVHQDPAMFPALTVAENIAIGRGFETTAIGSIRWRALRQRTQLLLNRFAIDAEPDTPASALRPADRAMVAIARALQDQQDSSEGVLVLDEPTASLPRAEVAALLAALRRYAETGQAILLVSHRLDEIVATADRASVLRDGQLVGTLDRAELSEQRLVQAMLGRALHRVFPAMPAVSTEQVALSVRHLAGGPLRDVSLAVRRGEVLGVAGVLGSGRSELLKMIFGGYPMRAGEVLLNGRPLGLHGVADAIRAGIAYVPEDRPSEAVFHDMSVRENLSATRLASYWRRWRLRHRIEAADAQELMHTFGIQASSDRQQMATLSGGNQQKAVLARWLRREPSILLLDEPTHGVDVGARAEIYQLVRQAVQRGASVLLVSSDFEELARVSNRVVVLAQGRVTAEVRAPDLEPARLTELVLSGEALRCG